MLFRVLLFGSFDAIYEVPFVFNGCIGRSNGSYEIVLAFEWGKRGCLLFTLVKVGELGQEKNARLSKKYIRLGKHFMCSNEESVFRLFEHL